jgi:Motility related/secretion protein
VNEAAPVEAPRDTASVVPRDTASVVPDSAPTSALPDSASVTPAAAPALTPPDSASITTDAAPALVIPDTASIATDAASEPTLLDSIEIRDAAPPVRTPTDSTIGAALDMPPIPDRPQFFLLSADTLPYGYFESPLRADRERLEYDFGTGQIRRVIAYNSVTLAPGTVYSPSEWRERVASTSLENLRRKSNVEALERQRTAGGDDLTKFEIPVKFPKAVSSVIGQGVNINVSGRESISFSGESNIPIKALPTEVGGPQTFPDLDMRQQLQINLDGQIGEKINVQVQHDSETSTPLANRIRLGYKGFEDEIIQKVEIGNTSLVLPGNQFVTFGGRQQGLFGAKVEGKAGKLDFSAVMSKQEGRTDRSTFIGSGSENKQVISDRGYEKNRIFNVTGEGGRRIYRSIDSIAVFWADDILTNDNEFGALVARAHLDGDPSRPAEATPGRFEQKIEGVDYEVNLTTGQLYMRSAVPEEYTLGVYYVLSGSEPIEQRRVGSRPATEDAAPAGPDTTILKLIRPENPAPGVSQAEDQTDRNTIFRETWQYQLRNYYDLHASGIQPDGFRVRILKRNSGQEDADIQQPDGTTFLRVLGLDNQGTTLNSPPDDQIDVLYENCNDSLPLTDVYLVDYENGFLIFPGEQPFDPVPGQEEVACNSNVTLLERNPTIYNKRYRDQKSSDEKYVIEVISRSAGQSQLSLGKSNILEGSEVVRLGDRVLVRGTDYTIQYEIGLIQFILPEARDPNARISVDFEYAPFLAQQQKSLFGVAGTYKFSPSTEVSGIWLYENSSTPYKRPRIGQEPSRAIVGGFAGQWRSEANFLSELVDKLPYVEAGRGSNVAVNGEIATSIPNPNTRNNIYVDDMEGTEENSNLGNGRRQWNYTSIPRPSTATAATDSLLDFRDRFKSIEWYNPEERVRRSDLNPTLDETEGDQFLTVLEIALRGGSFKTAADSGRPEDAWGGIMRLLSKSGVDYSRRKFIEVWINVPPSAGSPQGEGKLHIDLGTLSEDAMWQDGVAPNGRLDTEDRNGDGRLDNTGSEDPETDEDTGLDGLFNSQETCADTADCNEFDRTGDDWNYDEDNQNDYSRINRTQDNGILDTEDLNTNNGLTLPDDEVYFRYTVDLSEPGEAQGAPGTGWRLYRIPLRGRGGGELPVERPKLENDIKMARIWFSGFSTPDPPPIQIASIEVVGNRWLEGPLLSGLQEDSTRVPGYGLIADSTLIDEIGDFSIRTIDNKTGEDLDGDGQDDYVSPPIDLRESQGVVEQEQSLVLDFENLRAAHTGYALKDLFQDENYSRYATLNFWYQTREETGGDPWLFVRFGFDSLNFYEYRTPLVTGLGWQEVKLDLASLTQVKLAAETGEADSITIYREGRLLPYSALAVPGGEVAFVGSPTLTRVGVVMFGVMNRDTLPGATSGEVWVNELRLIDVLKDPGTATRVGFSADFADLASLNVNFSRIDDEFHSLGGTRTGSINSDVRLGGNVALHKFIENSGISLPLNWGWSKTKQLPDLRSGSDIVLADRESERTEAQDFTGSISISRTKKSKNTLMFHTIDAMSFNISGNKRNGFSPTRVDTSAAYRMSFGYAFRPRTPKQWNAYRSIRLAYFPTSISFSASKDETRTETIDTRTLANATTLADSARAKRDLASRRSSSSIALDASPITTTGITTSYNFVTTRDHGRGEETFVPGVNWGLEIGRSQNAGAKYVPSLPKMFQWLAPNVTYDTKYSETSPFDLEDDARAALGDTTEVRPKVVSNDNRSTLNLTISTTRLFGTPSPRPKGGEADSGGPGVMSAAGNNLRSLGRRFQDVRASLSLNRGSSYDRVIDRPGLAYQFGFADEIEASNILHEDGREDRFDRKRDISGRVSSGVTLPQSVGMTAEYATTYSRTERSRNTQEAKTVNWPRVNLNWNGLERIKAIQPYIESATVNTGYEVTSRESGTDLDRPDRREETKAWSPLFALAVTLQNTLRANLTANRSTSTSENFLGGTSATEGSSSDYRLGFDYRIQTARKVSMPLLGRGEPTAFTSELTLGMDFSIDKDKNVNLGRGEVREIVQQHTRRWEIRPKANYTFSKNVSGSMDAHYGESNDRKNEFNSRRTVGLSVAATLKF